MLERRERIIPYTGPSKGVLRVKRVNRQLGSPYPVDNYFYESEDSAIPRIMSGYQVTDTETHPEWSHAHKGTFTKDIGGPFTSLKRYTKSSGLGGAYREYNYGQEEGTWPDGRMTYTYKYSGPVFPMYPGDMSYPSVFPSSDDSLYEYGSTAIARCSPSNPSVDLTTAIGELLHEGIPKAIGATLKTWKGMTNRDRRQAIGNEYLNVEFGWKPLLSDLEKTFSSIVNIHAILEQYERNSGKLVRRRYVFPEEKDTTITAVGGVCAIPWYSPSTSDLMLPVPSPTAQVYQTDEVSVKRWFSGAFVYYVPPVSDSLRSELARAFIFARKALGLSLTPDSLWNLAPWSWAVDWFGNTGDILSNWTDWAIDNQVLLYGYIMEHRVHKRTYTYTGPTNISGMSCNDVTFVSETKVRRPATPYGFGLRYDDLSSRQKAIIGALGLSRSR